MITTFNTGLDVCIRMLMLSPGRPVNNVGVVLCPRPGLMNVSVLMSLLSRYQSMSCDCSQSSLSRTSPRHRPKTQEISDAYPVFSEGLDTTDELRAFPLESRLLLSNRPRDSRWCGTRPFNLLCLLIYVVVV